MQHAFLFKFQQQNNISLGVIHYELLNICYENYAIPEYSNEEAPVSVHMEKKPNPPFHLSFHYRYSLLVWIYSRDQLNCY
jgi:hypothetical protein